MSAELLFSTRPGIWGRGALVLWRRVLKPRCSSTSRSTTQEGQTAGDQLEKLSLCSALFSFGGTLPAIVGLTEMYCIRLWVEFFLYCGYVIELKEAFA